MGGGIQLGRLGSSNDSGILNVNDSVIARNKAGVIGEGGGINLFFGTYLRINRSVLRENEAQSGGSIYAPNCCVSGSSIGRGQYKIIIFDSYILTVV